MDNRESILKIVKDGFEYLNKDNFNNFNQLILDSWEEKKKTSNLITNLNIVNLEKYLKKCKNVYYKLCGAGGGGYMLIIKENKNSLDFLQKYSYININIDNRGIKSWELN
jgi:galactokinase/mevalonate kinase-like predicted kinase